jgi:tetratricopeptide (TPR) repeat protein
LKTHIHKILIAISLLITFISCDFTSAEEYHDEASELVNKGRFEEAIVKFDKAIELAPRFRLALIHRGYYKAFRLNDYQGGIHDFEKVLAFDSDNAAALYYIAAVYGDQSIHEKAIAFYTKTLETNNVQVASTLKFDLSAFGDYDDESLFMADGSDVYFQRGLHYVRIGEYDKAIEDLTRLVKARVYLNDSYFLIGEAYLGKKDTINACPNFMKSAEFGDQEAKKMLQKYCAKTNE